MNMQRHQIVSFYHEYSNTSDLKIIVLVSEIEFDF